MQKKKQRSPDLHFCEINDNADRVFVKKIRIEVKMYKDIDELQTGKCFIPSF